MIFGKRKISDAEIREAFVLVRDAQDDMAGRTKALELDVIILSLAVCSLAIFSIFLADKVWPKLPK